VGFGDEAVALALLGADGEEANAGPGGAEDDAGVVGAEDGVVHQVLGAGLGVGAGVDQDEMPLVARDDGGQGGPVHALHHAQAEGGSGHEGAGVAGTDGGGGGTGLDEFQGAHHRGVLLGLERLERLVVHRDHLGGVMDGDAPAGRQAGAGDERLQLLLPANEDDRAEPRLVGEGEPHRRHHLGRAEVAPHGINRNPGLARNRTGGFGVDDGSYRRRLDRDVEHLATAIHAGLGIDAVRAEEAAVNRVFGELGSLQGVGGAAVGAAALGLFAFRIGHGRKGEAGTPEGATVRLVGRARR